MAKKAGGKAKCVSCGRKFEADAIIEIDAKKYCPDCARARLKEKEINKKLNNFIYNLCGQDKDAMPFLGRQIKNMTECNGWKPSGILATLEYIYEELPNPPEYNPMYGIQPMVERYYPIARDRCLQQFQLDKFPDEQIKEIFNVKPIIINVKRSDIIQQREGFMERYKDRIYGKAIDLDEIDDTEELLRLEEMEGDE